MMGSRLSRRDCGLRGEICQGVSVVVVGSLSRGGRLGCLFIGEVEGLSGSGRKAARGLRIVVKMSLVRSMMPGRRSWVCYHGQMLEFGIVEWMFSSQR